MGTGTILYIVGLVALVGVLIGLIIYGRKQGEIVNTKRNHSGKKNNDKEEVVALPTEHLVDAKNIFNDLIMTDSGDLVAILEMNAVTMVAGSSPAGLDHAFVKAIEGLPFNTTLQIVSMPLPANVEALTDRYANIASDWRKKSQEARDSGDNKNAELWNMNYIYASAIGSTIHEIGGQASYRAALIVMTKKIATLFADAEPRQKDYDDFIVEIRQMQSLFQNAGIGTAFLDTETALSYLWHAYNPELGADSMIAAAAERFVDIVLGESSRVTPTTALTQDQLDLALNDPENNIKRVLAPPIVHDAEQHLEFANHGMLLYFITDVGGDMLPRISNLLGQGGRYVNRLTVSYYLEAPSPEEMALATRKASTAKQAQQLLAEKMGALPSYKQGQDVIAIEAARHGAETEQRIPRMLSLYLALLVPYEGEAEKEKILARAAAEFEGVMSTYRLQYVPAKFMAMNAWRSMIPLGQRHHHFEPRNVFSRDMFRLNPISSLPVNHKDGEFLGFTPISDDHYMPVSVLRERGKQYVPGDALIGSPGSGKSFTLKTWIVDWVTRGHRVIVIDPKMEFGPVAKRLGGSSVSAIGAKGFNLLRFDQFPVDANTDLAEGLAAMIFEDNLAAIISLYQYIKGGSAHVDGSEKTLLIKALRLAMMQNGMDPKDTRTWKPNAVILEDVYNVLVRELRTENPETVKLIAGNLDQYAHPDGQYYKTYNTRTEIDLDSHMVAISFGLTQFLTDPKTKALAYHFAIRMAAQHAIRTFIFSEKVVPIHIVIDEASQVLISADLVSTVARMLSLLPAYNVSLHLAFQDTNAIFRADSLKMANHLDSGNTLAGTIPAYWLFRQEPESMAAACQALNIPRSIGQSITNAQPGEGLIVMGGGELRIPIKIVPPSMFFDAFQTDPEAMRRMFDDAFRPENLAAEITDNSIQL